MLNSIPHSSAAESSADGQFSVISVRPGKAWGRAFTLVELLVVMAIILIIAGLTLPALKGTFNGVNLNGASDVVTGQLLFARQAAVTRNTPVEVRIYKYGEGRGETWNAIALVVPTFVSGRNIDQWLDTPHILGGGVLIDDAMSGSVSFSTVIQLAQTETIPTNAAPSPPAPWKTQEAANAPGILKNMTYVAFRYMPDGSTNLPDGSWCLTLRNANVPRPAGSKFPATNFVTVMLDPHNGRASTYRP